MNLFVKLIIIPLLAFAAGCTTQTQYGSIRKSNDVTARFESYDLEPGYNYYLCGDELHPVAIIGIDPAYTIRGKYWHPVTVTEDRMIVWAFNGGMRGAKGSGIYSGMYQGGDVLDPAMKKVGIWYSRYDWGVFKFLEDHVLLVYPPSLKAGAGLYAVRESY